MFFQSNKIFNKLVLISIALCLSSCGGKKSTDEDKVSVSSPTDITVQTVDSNNDFVVSWNYPVTALPDVTFDLCYGREPIEQYEDCSVHGGELLKNVQAPVSVKDVLVDPNFPSYFVHNAEIHFAIIATVDGQSALSESVTSQLENTPPVLTLANSNFTIGYSDYNDEPTETVQVGEAFIIDASKSDDPDGEIVSYSWSTLSGAESFEIKDKNSATPMIVFPSREALGESYDSYDEVVHITLEVNLGDNNGSHTTEVVSFYFDVENEQPEIQSLTANASTIKAGETITLHLESTDSDEDLITSYIRSDIDFISAIKVDENTYTFTVPSVSTDGVTPFKINEDILVSFKVSVEDPFGGEANETISVTILSEEEGVHTVVAPKLTGDISGFSFTKLNESGQDIPDDSLVWRCVRDNTTGLIWEAKDQGSNGVQGESLHDVDDEFVWYEPDFRFNGGTASFEERFYPLKGCYGYTDEDYRWCTSHSFSQRVNEEELCGSNKWRVPSIEELHSIASYSSEKEHYAYFPQLNDSEIDRRYISSTPSTKYFYYEFMLFNYAGNGLSAAERQEWYDVDDQTPREYLPFKLMLVQ